jgi:hypothetical protein
VDRPKPRNRVFHHHSTLSLYVLLFMKTCKCVKILMSSLFMTVKKKGKDIPVAGLGGP